MKQQIVMSFALAALLIGSFGCSKETEGATERDVRTPQTATTEEIAGTTNPNDLNPIEANYYVGNVEMGHQLGLDGRIAADRKGNDFSPGQTVYVTMSVDNAPANAAVKVAWYGPNDTMIDEEQQNVPVGATTLAFSADTSNWAKGDDYRAEVWIGDEKVDTTKFKLVDLADADTAT